MLILLLLLFATPALAVDGVLEINQTCAVSTGCFSGDTAGFPVTITASGSYRLTSNLRRTIQLGGSQNAHFIEISADDVSVDLGGFLISCATILGGSCSGSGSGVEVADGNNIRGARVSNGSISGMAAHGVLLGPQAQVTSLRSRGNGQTGISVNAGSIVSGNTTLENEVGIWCFGGGTLIVANTARGNNFGISLGAGDVYRENVVTDNDTAPLLAIGINRGDNYCAGPGTISSFCP
jgi:hypothetical protein